MKKELRVRDAQYAVEMFHASLLVFGIAGVTIGFLLSLMYLVQHNRLKHKTPDPDSLQLYSLERLGRMNWWAVVSSVPLLTLGMLAGVCLAWKSRATATPVDLTAPGFLVMYALWLAMIVLFGWLVTRQQSSGKIVAWRTLWACGFLLLTMICLEVFTGGIHGKQDRGTGTSARPSASQVLIHHGGTEARRPVAVGIEREREFGIQRQVAKTQRRNDDTTTADFFAPLRPCVFALNSSFFLCLKLRLGQHIPEAPRHSRARGLRRSKEKRRLWETSIYVSEIFRYAVKQSFEDMRSQAELGTEGKPRPSSVPPCLRGHFTHVEDGRANVPVPRPTEAHT